MTVRAFIGIDDIDIQYDALNTLHRDEEKRQERLLHEVSVEDEGTPRTKNVIICSQERHHLLT